MKSKPNAAEAKILTRSSKTAAQTPTTKTADRSATDSAAAASPASKADCLPPPPTDWLSELKAMRESIVRAFKNELRNIEQRLSQKISELSNEMLEIKNSQKLVNVTLTAVEATCEEVPAIKKQLLEIQKEVEKFESHLVSTDVIINGIPKNSESSNADLFKANCNAVKYEVPAVRDIFKLPAKRDADFAPIVVKLSSPQSRIEFFKAVAAFAKSNKRALTLEDIGMTAKSNIHIHECLTKANRELMYHASQLKRQNFLSACFSIRGSVFVRKKKGEEAIRVVDRNQIDELVIAQHCYSTQSALHSQSTQPT